MTASNAELQAQLWSQTQELRQQDAELRQQTEELRGQDATIRQLTDELLQLRAANQRKDSELKVKHGKLEEGKHELAEVRDKLQGQLHALSETHTTELHPDADHIVVAVPKHDVPCPECDASPLSLRNNKKRTDQSCYKCERRFRHFEAVSLEKNKSYGSLYTAVCIR